MPLVLRKFSTDANGHFEQKFELWPLGWDIRIAPTYLSSTWASSLLI